MTGKTRILVVDDQPTILDQLATVLTGHGFAVDTATTAEQAVAKAAVRRPDLVLVDVMLPDGEGRDVCRRLREKGADAGVVFLTALDARPDLIADLAYGGDEWITKPFDVEVLMSRVYAMLRRVPGAPGNRVLRYADLELDQVTRLVRRSGEAVPLSTVERDLLRCFLRNPDRALSRPQLMAAAGVADVEPYVASLRGQLDRLGPPLIVTHRGFGYALRADLP